MAGKISLGVVVSEFNYDITSKMLERAKEHAKFLGAEVAEVVKVPGAFDSAIGVKKMVDNKNIDGVVNHPVIMETPTRISPISPTTNINLPAR